MSHTFAARCVICDAIDDPMCPECGLPSSDAHGTTDQGPFRSILTDGYVHQWHADCLASMEDE